VSSRVVLLTSLAFTVIKRGNSMSNRLKGLGALGVVAIVAAVAGAAHAREQADIYTVHALVSDGATLAALGPVCRPHDPMVGGEQRQQHLDAL
jgi:hypothetical protein